MTASVPAYGSSSSFALRRPVLADRLPKSVVRDVALVVGVAAFMSLVAQVSFKLPNNPVPITGQTFGVLLSAAAVGPLRGLAGQLLYIAIGWAGLPVFAGHHHGWAVLHGPNGGYLVGFGRPPCSSAGRRGTASTAGSTPLPARSCSPAR